jgi:hypothetical protein
MQMLQENISLESTEMEKQEQQEIEKQSAI